MTDLPDAEPTSHTDELTRSATELPLSAENVLFTLLEASDDCVKVLDLDGRLLFMSEGGKRVMEVDDFGKLKDRLWPDFWTGEGNKLAWDAVRQAREGRHAQFAGFANTAKGNRRYWDVQVHPVRQGDQVTHIISVSRDTSSLKSAGAEMERLASEARENEMGFRTLADTMPQMVWSTLPDGYHDYYNARWYEFTGMAPGSTDGEGWNNLFHPDDQQRAWSIWRESLATGKPYEIEYRLRHHSGQYRWTLGRALPMRDQGGQIVRWYGTCTDIDDAKKTGESLAILSQELSHRIKNIFAILNGLIGLSARRFPESKQFALDIQQRIGALGRAHDYARPHSPESRISYGAATIQALLGEILKPYPALQSGALRIEGDEVEIDDRSATPLALIFHELATNSTKYGALSSPTGEVILSISVIGENCLINWTEQGGPELAGPPEKTGFGTRLSSMSAEDQLGGTIERDWRPEGLSVSISCPVANLRRP